MDCANPEAVVTCTCDTVRDQKVLFLFLLVCVCVCVSSDTQFRSAVSRNWSVIAVISEHRAFTKNTLARIRYNTYIISTLQRTVLFPYYMQLLYPVFAHGPGIE